MQEKVIATRRVKTLTDANLAAKVPTMEAFLHAAAEPFPAELFSEKNIVIQGPPRPLKLATLKIESLEISEQLSFSISKRHIVAIYEKILTIVTDPIMVASYLSPLDKALSEELARHNISFSDKDSPDYLISGNGYFVPGPPPEGYKLRQQAGLLDKILIASERKRGVNIEESSPKFIGYVNTELASAFVRAGHTFLSIHKFHALFCMVHIVIVYYFMYCVPPSNKKN